MVKHLFMSVFLTPIGIKKIPGPSSRCYQRHRSHAEGKTGRKSGEDDLPPSHSQDLSTQDPPPLHISGRMEEENLLPDQQTQNMAQPDL